MVINEYQKGYLENEQKLASLFEWAHSLRKMGKKPIDLSIGNPDIGPPKTYYEAAASLISQSRSSNTNTHGYVPNSGLPGARQRIAEYLTTLFQTDFEWDQVFITAGAANALDVLMRILVEPLAHFKGGRPSLRQAGSDREFKPTEVLILAPYFLEYTNYIERNQGSVRVAQCDGNFRLDFDDIEKNITKRTRVLILNSPNNPTGAVYRESELVELANILKRKNREFHTSICVIEDGAYAQVVYNRADLPSIMPHYPHTFFVGSFSKSLGIAGERIGYIAMHPDIAGSREERTMLRQIVSLNIRMTIVGAPRLQQRIIEEIGCETTVDIEMYHSRVSRLSETMAALGFDFPHPEGAFYIFARIPNSFSDAQSFEEAVHTGDDPLLYIPGYAFGGEKYGDFVRFSVCVDEDTVERACKKLTQVCKGT